MTPVTPLMSVCAYLRVCTRVCVCVCGFSTRVCVPKRASEGERVREREKKRERVREKERESERDRVSE